MKRVSRHPGLRSDSSQVCRLTYARRTLSVVLSLIFVTVSSPIPMNGYKNPAPTPPADSGTPTDSTPMSASQLQALVAPIALYPDSLVAQILTAATFPDQVAIGNYWMQHNNGLAGSALMQAVDKQSWDPSIKALTEFPSVLDNLAKNLTDFFAGTRLITTSRPK